ncbi:hypothetical protein [Falsiroseomonas selenitidurans]|uniref:Uncharacterized protein n=1 Tax=Falsiroseomonas selenitidurans TaxID=2716335 RepID=A0ABX1DWR4_9PROT|nr:hypothetical protein [Falsiroseomonas selenitidurans]NKC29343.1 hypothetical protein [Falsiroseomonas selenitidurans]
MSALGENRAAPDIRGFVDGLTGNQIDGWAFEPAQPTERVVVELRLDGGTVATTVADRHRADLIRAGVGDAFHGFRFPLKPAWAERRADLQVVARGAEGGEVSLPLFRRGAPMDARADPRPAPPSPQVLKAIEQLVAGQRALESRLQELALRPAPEPYVPAAAEPAEAEQRLAVLEAWVARLDERLASLQAAAPPPARGGGPAGLDTWQVVLMALLAVTGLGALTVFALVLAL